MPGDFDFDEFGGFDTDDTDDFFGGGDTGSDDFFGDSEEDFFGDEDELGDNKGIQYEESGGTSEVVKLGIIMIVVAIVLIIITFVIRGAIKGRPKNKAIDKVNQIVSQQEPGTVNQNISQTGNNDWIQFTTTKGDVYFQDERLDSTFTVTKVTHYAKVATSDGEYVTMKTILTGNLSGLVGTYELEIPYNKGTRISVGNSFSVAVEYGEYDGKFVIGEIEY